MLGMLALMAMTMAGADDNLCAPHVEVVAVEEMVAASEAARYEAEMYEAEIYADAESDFEDVLAEAGLDGSTLARAEIRARSGDALAAAFARNR